MPPASSEPALTRRVFRVGGMHCNNCAASIEKALDPVGGIREANVSFALEEARVAFDPDAISAEGVAAAIEAAGFRARLRSQALQEEEKERVQEEHETLKDRRRKMAVGIGLSAAIMAGTMGVMRFAWPDFPARLPLVAIAAGIVQFYVGGEYYRGAWKAARLGTTSMDTLVALGSSVAFFYSLAVLALGLDQRAFPVYFESAAMIVTLVMVGKFLEARGRSHAGDAVRTLLAGQPDRARVVRGDDTALEGAEEVNVGDVRVGAVVAVRPFERFPLDGVVCDGESHVDESMLTGESKPRRKALGDTVFAGTMNQNGALRFKVSAEASETTLAAMAELVREAQATQAPIAQSADRIAALFVPAILLLAVVVGAFWGFYGSARFFPDWHPLSTGLVFSAATLLISCPCALGLATPLALIAGTGAAAERGLLFKNATALEGAADLSTLVFDKTGTLTLGEPTVEEIFTLAPETRERDWLRAAIAVEQHSEHPLAAAILRFAESQGIERARCERFEAIPGRGVRGEVEGHRVAIGNLDFLETSFDEQASPLEDSNQTGQTRIFVAIDGTLVGSLSIGDALRPTTASALHRLAEMGLSLRILSGDEPSTAIALADRLGLPPESVDAGVLPADKSKRIDSLRAAGERVAMVGDGINDAPALAAADLGIAVGSGTDVALEAADLILIESDLERVPEALTLSRRTMRTIRQNLFWAFAYNVAAIPLAAGALVPAFGAGARLSPGVAAGAMALSSLFVVLNSLRLRRAHRSLGSTTFAQ